MPKLSRTVHPPLYHAMPHGKEAPGQLSDTLPVSDSSGIILRNTIHTFLSGLQSSGVGTMMMVPHFWIWCNVDVYTSFLIDLMYLMNTPN